MKGRRIQSPAEAMTEARLQQNVRELCLLLRLPHYHTHRSQRSEPGFPDSVIIRGNTIIFAELKTERGKLSEAQAAWIAALQKVPGVTAVVWRPSDWVSGAIERQLRDDPPRQVAAA